MRKSILYLVSAILFSCNVSENDSTTDPDNSIISNPISKSIEFGFSSIDPDTSSKYQASAKGGNTDIQENAASIVTK